VIQSRRIRLAVHVAHIEERIEACRFWWGNLGERDHLENPGIDGRIILRWIFRKCDGGCMDWIGVAQNRDRWRTLANAVMQFRFP
jgi:hypothetical protein